MTFRFSRNLTLCPKMADESFKVEILLEMMMTWLVMKFVCNLLICVILLNTYNKLKVPDQWQRLLHMAKTENRTETETKNRLFHKPKPTLVCILRTSLAYPIVSRTVQRHKAFIAHNSWLSRCTVCGRKSVRGRHSLANSLLPTYRSFYRNMY